MQLFEIFLIAIALSMDAFAISICKGLKMTTLSFKQTTLIALFFGGFQAIMPFIGWAAGKSFEKILIQYDHWVAFGLLAFIGIKMIRDSFDCDDDTSSDFDIKELFILSVATSI
ncbi:MAG: manganese efflux pump, partial [Clostridia bacterium]|nr:manganese efflux pump [Clostridia bacterium]